MNRRNILTLLGVAAPASVAVEMLANPEIANGSPKGIPGVIMRSPEAQERFASMLEHMAKSIRRNDMACLQIRVESQADLDSWMKHRVIIDCEIDATEDATS